MPVADFFAIVVGDCGTSGPSSGCKAAIGAAEARLAIEIGHDDERELEALGVVDRHQANDVGRFGQRGGERFLGLAGR